MWLTIFSEGLIGVFQIWGDPSIAGDHFVHAATFMTMIWIFGLAMLVQLYRPAKRVTAMQLALVITVIALLTEAPQIISGEFMLLVFLARSSSSPPCTPLGVNCSTGTPSRRSPPGPSCSRSLGWRSSPWRSMPPGR